MTAHISPDWKEHFAPHILERGRDYCWDERVCDMGWSGNTVAATVCGSEDYEVILEFKKGRLISAYCDCPYAEGGSNCKHMAAVLFALEMGIETEPVPEPPREASAPTGASFEKLIKGLTAAQAKDLLLTVASGDGAL